MENKKIELPLLALRGLTIFPNMVIHFDVNREKSINALEKAMVENQLIFLVAQKEVQNIEPKIQDLYEVGTIARVKQLIKLPRNIIRVLIEGEERARIVDYIQEEPYYLVGLVKNEVKNKEDNIESEAYIRLAGEIIDSYVNSNSKIGEDTFLQLLSINNIGELADQIAINMPLEFADKQNILEEFDEVKRLKLALDILKNEIEINKMKAQIQTQLKQKIEKNQKDYYLREQIKIIQEELGEKFGIEDEVEEYKDRMNRLKASKEVKDKINKEIIRMSKIPTTSAEAVVVRNYIETLLELPWDLTTKETKDLKNAEKILEEDHYGLKKVKESV